MRDAGARAREEVYSGLVQLHAVGMPHVAAGPTEFLGVFSGRPTGFSRLYATSLSFSARWVWSETPSERAKLADSRMRSRLTENGDRRDHNPPHGKRATRRCGLR